jgi:hypothetical protein
MAWFLLASKINGLAVGTAIAWDGGSAGNSAHDSNIGWYTMAKAVLKFMPFPVESLPQAILDDLKVIDEAKARINATLAQAAPEGYKAQHSYKLDFAFGKRMFKVAFYRPATAKATAPELPQMTLGQFIAAQTNSGHRA